MSDGSDYYDSNSESDEESVQNVVLTKKTNKPIEFNHAKQFGGYEEDESVVDDSEPDDADLDEDENDDDEQIGGVDDETEEGEIKDDADEDSGEDDSDIEIDEDGQAV
jgi:hypothetical protein